MDFKILIAICWTSLFSCRCHDNGPKNLTYQPCIRRSFGASSSVCVCNSTYCDTIEAESVLQSEEYAVYETTKSGLRMKKSIFKMSEQQYQPISINYGDKPLDALEIKFDIKVNKTRQTVIGFGGTFTDASGINIGSLPDSAQDNLIQAYFGAGGIEYTLGRIPIASNDMSTEIYSYDFTPGDTYLSKFTIDENDHLYKIPYIDKSVLASRRKVLLYGSPWSSPDWMKSNDDMVGYGTVLSSMAKVYANYLARFLAEYEGFMEHGRMWGITSQSGPARSCSNHSRPVYQSMCWTAEMMRNWTIHDLKPSLNEYNYSYIKLFTMDDNRDELPAWSDVFNDDDARAVIDGFAVQGYHDNLLNASVLSDAYHKFPDKIFLGSEFCVRQEPVIVLGSWERGETLGRSIFQDMSNYMSGFTHYNLAVNMSGGPSWVDNNADSPIVVDSDIKVFYKQPMFYFMGHFSKFLPYGSRGLGLTYIETYFEFLPAVAFLRPDGSVCFIIANYKDEQFNIVITQGRHVIKFMIKPSSIQTFTWMP
ncbi:hypothetical protein ACF0H5_004012 [Mactra antiquata]